MKNKNRQKYVVLVTGTSGISWPVGTPTQRGFTEAGVETALTTIREALPRDWACRKEEIQPIDYLLDSVAHIRKKG